MRATSALAALAAVGVTIALAGCGDDEAGSAPQDAVPADAVVYLEGVVKPEGEIGDDIDEMLSRFGAESPAPLIIDEINQGLADQGSEMTYEDDIEPWLGERLAMYFDASIVGSDSSDGLEHGAVMLETTDEDAARQFIEQAMEEGDQEYTEETYEGYDYFVDPEGAAGGLVGDLIVIGTDETFQATVDTIEGGEGLADDETFSEAMEESDDALGSFFVDLERMVDESGARSGPDAAELERFEEIAPGVLSEPVVGMVEIDDENVSLSVSSGSFGSLSSYVGATGDTEATGGLPETAWGAVSYVDLGETYLEALEQASGFQGFDRAELELFERQIQQRTGLTADEALGAIGDVGVFITGDSVPDLGGAAIVEILDEQAGDQLLDSFERLAGTGAGVRVGPLSLPGREGFEVTVPDVPQPINFVREADRWVIGFGADATEEALEPTGALADKPSFAAAEDAVDDGMAINTFFEIAPILELITSSPLGISGDYVAARPYLEHLEFVALAGGDDGETSRFELIVGTQ